MLSLEALEGKLYKEYKKHLEKYDVKFPTKQKLTTLLYLYDRMPNWISKDELTDLVRVHHEGSGDLQEARHLADLGWAIVSSNARFHRGICDPSGPSNSYKLGSVHYPNPEWLTKNKVKRRGFLAAESWNELLIVYKEHGCAVCGQKYTHYDKGHIDSAKPPELGNIVPMCVECNQFAQAHQHDFFMKGLIARGYKK